MHEQTAIDPDYEQARRAAAMAHNIVVKLKEMGLPDDLDGDLSKLCTDLGDLWSTQRSLTSRLNLFLRRSAEPWEDVGNHLMDIKADIEHIAWHIRNIKRPLNRIVHYAYRESQQQK